ncbi:MAG: capsular biosynthesis protein [Bacteroidetes bacterium]|nr:capsular biosynthesis protein [Bacteroidota bacterium]
MNKKPQKLPDSFVNPIKVDFHSHYLPGIDDGCKEIGESIAILKVLQDKGYRKAVTTPHVMGDFYKNTPEIILGKLEEVRNAMREEGMTIELDAAAEYYLDEWFEDKIAKKNILTFGDNYVLIETGFIEPPTNLISTIFNLKTSGYKPVLAHPERYQYFDPNKEIYEQLMDSGVLFQMNLLSIIGYYSPQVKKIAEHLIHHKKVNFIGGDTHNMKHLFLVQEEACRSMTYEQVVKLPLLNNEL